MVLWEWRGCELAYDFWKAEVSLGVIISFSSSFLGYLCGLFFFFPLLQEYSSQANSLTRKVTLMMNVETCFSKHWAKTPAEIIFLHLCMAPSPTFFSQTNVTFQLVLSKNWNSYVRFLPHADKLQLDKVTGNRNRFCNQKSEKAYPLLFELCFLCA